MNYIVFDLEYNQPFKFNEITGKLENSKIIGGVSQEIIQIGAIKLDSQYNVIDSFLININPMIYPYLHPVVRRIISSTSDEIYGGTTFEDAVVIFKKWIGNEYTLYCWGDDILSLINNCNYYKIDTVWINNNMDLQKIISLDIFETKQDIALKTACKHFDIKFDTSRIHNALYDAQLTAMVFKKYYGKISKQTLEITKPKVERVDYEVSDNLHIALRCPHCGRFVKNDSGWIQRASKKVIALGYCNYCYQYVYGHISFESDRFGKYYLKRMTNLKENDYMALVQELQSKRYYKLKSIQNWSSKRLRV